MNMTIIHSEIMINSITFQDLINVFLNPNLKEAPEVMDFKWANLPSKEQNKYLKNFSKIGN